MEKEQESQNHVIHHDTQPTLGGFVNGNKKRKLSYARTPGGKWVVMRSRGCPTRFIQTSDLYTFNILNVFQATKSMVTCIGSGRTPMSAGIALGRGLTTQMP